MISGIFILFLLILSLLLVHFGVIAFSIFWRFILPILLILFAIKILISGILLLLNPYFWILIGLIVLVVWAMNKFNKR
ncbi:hypothetical protein [Lactococcus sp.]|uniref:hypothetical protein n=1 Tax=Lactococcus sp. TaxID=44273 RepID=UPI0035B18524